MPIVSTLNFKCVAKFKHVPNRVCGTEANETFTLLVVSGISA